MATVVRLRPTVDLDDVVRRRLLLALIAVAHGYWLEGQTAYTSLSCFTPIGAKLVDLHTNLRNALRQKWDIRQRTCPPLIFRPLPSVIKSTTENIRLLLQHIRPNRYAVCRKLIVFFCDRGAEAKIIKNFVLYAFSAQLIASLSYRYTEREVIECIYTERSWQQRRTAVNSESIATVSRSVHHPGWLLWRTEMIADERISSGLATCPASQVDTLHPLAARIFTSPSESCEVLR